MNDDPLDALFNEIDSKKNTRKTSLFIDDDEDIKEINGNPEQSEKQTIEKDIEKGKKKQLVPLRKNIYIVPKEISCKDQKEVAEIRKKLGNIVVHGLDVPCPIEHWTECGLPEPVMSLIKLRGFTQPTSVQCQAIPCILSGRDIIGCAVTGSGKTLAFILPCLLHVLAQQKTGQNEAAALLLSPTRELAIQTHLECKAFLELVGKDCACLVGGADIGLQMNTIKNGVSVIIATPGRFIDLLSHSSFNLDRVGFLVIDEADRMFDLGFEPQVLRIAECMRPDRQTLMFSATFPHSVERCARKLLTNSIEIVVGARNIVSSEILQTVYVIPEEQKFNKLLKILGDHAKQGQALVFTNTQDKAELLFGQLNKYGYSVSLLHAGMEQTDRASILYDFREGKFNILVLTSVGARGIDIATICLVVNYDAPDHEADYVHRIGRTGRAGKKGFGYTFITEDEAVSAREIRSALKRSGAEIPEDLDKLCGDGKSTKMLGFRRGKGFKFNKDETKALLEHRKATTGKENIKSVSVEGDDGDADDDQSSEEEEANESIKNKDDDDIKKINDNLYIAEAQINDYTQQARIAVASASGINSVMEETGTNIIQKGVFCPPGIKPPVGEKTLYLRVEGTTKYAVQVALSRIKERAQAADPLKSRIKKKF